MNVPCICPPDGTRHPDGDTITLRERLDFRSASTMRKVISLVYAEDPDASVADILAALTENYLLLGVQAWSLVDATGKPIEVSKPAIREHLLSHQEIAMEVGDAADELYSESVINPLVAKGSKSSPDMPMDASTSATTGTPVTAPTDSRPSSITTSPTDGTEMTSLSLVGASSSSPNSR